MSADKTPMQMSIERMKKRVSIFKDNLAKTPEHKTGRREQLFSVIECLEIEIQENNKLLPVEREFWIDARDTPAYLNREDYEKDFDKKYGTDGE